MNMSAMKEIQRENDRTFEHGNNLFNSTDA